MINYIHVQEQLHQRTYIGFTLTTWKRLVARTLLANKKLFAGTPNALFFTSFYSLLVTDRFDHSSIVLIGNVSFIA